MAADEHTDVSIELPEQISEDADVEVARSGRVHDGAQAGEHAGAAPAAGEHAGAAPGVVDDGGQASEEDAPEPAELDPETRARRDAALRHVRKLGDPVLRAKALPVERFDDELKAEVERMGELMQDALGVGLAATQLGVLHRVLVYKAFVEDPVTALVNPEIEWVSDELEPGDEGCLSLPGVHVEVERHARLKVRGRDEAGDQIEIDAEGFEARVIQHEVDHLNGVLILDRISREARKEAMRAMREAREDSESRSADAA
jgi:peptide deformylase